MNGSPSFSFVCAETKQLEEAAHFIGRCHDAARDGGVVITTHMPFLPKHLSQGVSLSHSEAMFEAFWCTWESSMLYTGEGEDGRGTTAGVGDLWGHGACRKLVFLPCPPKRCRPAEKDKKDVQGSEKMGTPAINAAMRKVWFGKMPQRVPVAIQGLVRLTPPGGKK